MRRLHSSPRSRVWYVERDDGTPTIVKQIVDGDDPDARFTRELRALELANRADPPIAPRILEVDAPQRTMVLEYLDRHRPDEHWATGYAEALARLHATTGPADRGELPPWQGPAIEDVDAFLRFAAALDVTVDPAVREELLALLDRLDPTGHHALLHGDPCPGNDLHTANGVRFVDFEQASLGNGLVELAYLHIAFPTCWSSTALPPHLLAEAETAYRETWRRITGTDVAGSLADACTGWSIRGDMLVQLAQRGTRGQLARVLTEDWDWGPPTAHERLVHRLGVVADLIAAEPGQGDLRAFAPLAKAVRSRLLERRPALRPLPTVRDERLDTDS